MKGHKCKADVNNKTDTEKDTIFQSFNLSHCMENTTCWKKKLFNGLNQRLGEILLRRKNRENIRKHSSCTVEKSISIFFDAMLPRLKFFGARKSPSRRYCGAGAVIYLKQDLCGRHFEFLSLA